MFVAAFAVFLVALLSPEVVASTAYYDNVRATSCSTTNITVGQSGRNSQGFIVFPNTTNSAFQLFCNTTVNLQTRPEYRLHIRFRKLRLDCNRGAYVTVSGKTNSRTYCGWWTDWPSLYSSANYLNVSYYHGNYTASSSEGVELYYTAYREGECSDDDDDDDDDDHDDHHDDHDHNSHDHEFECWNDRCISSGLKCDGIDNCGDWSDESMWTCGLSTAWIVAISVTCSILGVTLLLTIFCYCKTVKTRRSRTDASPRPTTASVQVNVESPARTTSTEIQGEMPVPPPYTYHNTMVALNSGPKAGGPVGEAWSSMYNEKSLHEALPPHYDDISVRNGSTNGQK